jgi:hypothetical protein
MVQKNMMYYNYWLDSSHRLDRMMEIVDNEDRLEENGILLYHCLVPDNQD